MLMVLMMRRYSNDDNNLNNEPSNMNIYSSVKKYNCLCSLKEVSTTLRCSKCITALCCGRACQEKHWPVHKNNRLVLRY